MLRYTVPLIFILNPLPALTFVAKFGCKIRNIYGYFVHRGSKMHVLWFWSLCSFGTSINPLLTDIQQWDIAIYEDHIIFFRCFNYESNQNLFETEDLIRNIFYIMWPFFVMSHSSNLTVWFDSCNVGIILVCYKM
jgi:hypothetical protein